MRRAQPWPENAGGESILSLRGPFFQELARTGNAVADPKTGANVIAFTSGWGDGLYASYWGLDAKAGADRIVQLWVEGAECFTDAPVIRAGRKTFHFRPITSSGKGTRYLTVLDDPLPARAKLEVRCHVRDVAL